MAAVVPAPTRRLPPMVRALALVSLLTDAASEMIYPLLPVFLTTVLGASPAMLGVVEGAAESTASLVKLASGWYSDRMRRYKPLMLIGYTIATLTRPFVSIASSASQVLTLRIVDRIGKGVRGAPRDALLAGSVDASIRGRAFGFHRAADHLGAVIGPLIAWVLLQRLHLELRTVFALSVIPGLLAVITIVVAVREPQAIAKPGADRTTLNADADAVIATDAERELRGEVATLTADADADADAAIATDAERKLRADVSTPARMPRRFWAVLGVLLLFTLGNSSDAFLLLRAQQLGIPIAMLPVLWAVHHMVKSAASVPGGALSDRIGRRTVVLIGWAWYAFVYAGFAFATTAWQAWALFLAYGLYFGLVEGAEKALIADLAPAQRAGTAFGWYNAVIGVAALPASLLLGALWTAYGPAMAFGVGASLAACAMVLGLFVLPRRAPV